MKKFFPLLFFFIFCVTAKSQHINFMGQPLGCNLETFTKQMLSKGFRHIGGDPNTYIDGTFGGDKVSIYSYKTPVSKIVYEVEVAYYKEKWMPDNEINSYFTNKKNLLVQSFMRKYGNPVENIDSRTSWKVQGGSIEIYLNKSGWYYNAVKIKYSDNESKSKISSERKTMQDDDY